MAASAMKEIEENIKRLKHTILLNSWNPGHVANCKASIKSCESQLTELNKAQNLSG